MLINSKGSTTYDNSVQAIELFYEEYPEYRDGLHIHSFDGMGYNALYGAPVVHAAQMSADGASLEEIGLSVGKRLLFALAGAGLDRAARREGKEYRFLFVRADGGQLEAITRIVEAKHILPRIDPHEFDLSGIRDALALVSDGHINGKVILRL